MRLGAAVGCRQSNEPPSCTDVFRPCTWTDAQALTTPCASPPATPYYAVRCGSYDGLVQAGIDSWIYFYYGESGALVGKNEGGLTNEPGCVSYDPAFKSAPTSCKQTAPECRLDGGASPCDCDSQEQPLECVCLNGACRSFADAMANVSCEGVMAQTMRRGCGMTALFLGRGFSAASTLVYEGPNNTLVGVTAVNDVPFGDCELNEYSTAIPDLTGCPDYSICDLCGSGALPACNL